MKDIAKHTVLLSVVGSRAYGIHTPESDLDTKGVMILPRKYTLGYLYRCEQVENPLSFFKSLNLKEDYTTLIQKEEVEGSIYELSKFIRLATDCNPNILDVLFSKDEHILYCTPEGEMLREAREMFISAKAKHTFSGYAYSQLKRIKGHRAWLLNPPKAKPTRKDFDLPEYSLIPREHREAIEAAVKKEIDSWNIDYGLLEQASINQIQYQVEEYLSNLQLYSEQNHWYAAAKKIGLNDKLIYTMQQERAFKSAHRYWKQYQNWKHSRNAARAALEEKFGYDCKHGAHLLRLLRMGHEVLTTGKVHVDRTQIDAEEIKAIRQGAWPYEKLVSEAERLDSELTRIYKEKLYVIPHAPQRESINDLCVSLIESKWKRS